MDYFSLFIALILILLFPLPFVILHFRKKTVLKKIRSLDSEDKNQLLNELGKPFGYLYDPYQDIFATRQDAPQKAFGYTHFYDTSAAYFNMIFDYETVYFDYRGRTWLIEMWKGQYGINTGCELGVYCADTLVSPTDYRTTLFHAVSANDMPDISLQMNQHTTPNHHDYTELGYRSDKHWWLTLFKMGVFTKPENVSVNSSIRFKNYMMMRSFLDSFRTTLPHVPYKVYGFTVYFTFHESRRQYSPWHNKVRGMALASCRLYCKWFNYVTRPFDNTGSKLLYLYYYLPFAAKRIFRTHTK